MVVPYKDLRQSKKSQVALMFNNIAGKYDLLNHLLSFNIDKHWRNKAVASVRNRGENLKILDVATGTGDFAFTALRLNPKKVEGIDISDSMLEVGKQKAMKRGVTDKIEFLSGDAENIPFAENSFDIALCGFGVRNFEDLSRGIEEIYRVLAPGGQVVILEFSKPAKAPFKQLYSFYFTKLLPLIGRMISRDKSAYSYLPDSVRSFPDGREFIKVLSNAGFKGSRFEPLTFGIATIYVAFKSPGEETPAQ